MNEETLDRLMEELERQGRRVNNALDELGKAFDRKVDWLQDQIDSLKRELEYEAKRARQ